MIVKVEPWPGVLSTAMLPPSISQKCLVIARPSPVPPYRRVVDASAWLKAWKSRPCCSSVMPMPVSLTMNEISPSPGLTSSSTRPSWVNLPALLNRLRRLCLSLVRSV